MNCSKPEAFFLIPQGQQVQRKKETEPEQNVPAMDSTHNTSIRDQVVNLFREVPEILNKFSTLLFAFIAFAATNSDTGKSLFMKQHKLMISLLLIIVLYFFFVMIGTILHIYNRSTLLPFITCAILVLGSAASVMALSIVSSTIAWITLTLWVGMFTLVAYQYAVPQRINNWIKSYILAKLRANTYQETALNSARRVSQL